MSTRVAYLGPKGTFAEKAASALAEREKLTNPVFVPYIGLESVIEAIASQNSDAGVVPIENSVEGGVTSTLDSLWKHPELFIQRALVLPIKHCLLSSGSVHEISEVLSHPQALAQCRGWLQANLPNALLLPTSSTAEAVRMVEGSKFRAAIGAKPSKNQSNLKEIAFPINDVIGNKTRFILLTANKNKLEGNIASIAFSLKQNSPGALLKALSCIGNLGLNMSRIESRPSKRELGEYVFFIDLELNKNSQNLIKKLSESLFPFCEHLVEFGSYPSEDYKVTKE